MFKKVLFLETRQNFVWTSMQEILPQISILWEELSQSENFELKKVNVDDFDRVDFKVLFDCDYIVCSAFNLNSVGFLKTIRAKMGIRVPMAFYLHGLATVGLWPLAEFGLWPLLLDNDIFMGTCEGDINCLNLLGIENSLKTLFSSDENLIELPPLEGAEIKDILYIGRISHQKNLETLIDAFNTLSREDKSLKLHIYGEEDHLDSPNLGLKRTDYLKELKGRASSGIHFHGFVQREKIKEQWREKNFLFCSPSLHSDENFGMAALMALEIGGRLLLSDWGGHQNYKKMVPNRVETVQVMGDETGVYLDPLTFTSQLRKSLKGEGQGATKSPFHRALIARELFDGLQQFLGSSSEMPKGVPELTKKLCEKRRLFVSENSDHQQRVFSSKKDPDYQAFFRAYGCHFN